MPSIRKPPTGADVRRLSEELTSLWGGAFSRDQRARDVASLKNRVELLPNRDDLNIKPVELHSGRYGSLIDHAVTFVGTLPGVSVEPLDQTTDARRDSEQIERGFKSLFHQQLVANGFWNNLGIIH